MKEVYKITSVLTVTCIVCAFLLSVVFSAAKGKIEINEQKRVKEAITSLAPKAIGVEQLNAKDQIIYKLTDTNKKLLGYAFIAKGQGYQGTIKILSVIDPTLTKLEGIEIIESVETPGLGAKIQDMPFRKQFNGLSIAPKIECVKDKAQNKNQITAITGATISSRAVVNILNTEIKRLEEFLKK